MFLRLGTQKWHITLELLYWYTVKQLNLIGVTTPLFSLIITAWIPSIYFRWQHPYWVFWVFRSNEKFTFWHGTKIIEKSK